jgi:hypothetical protein
MSQQGGAGAGQQGQWAQFIGGGGDWSKQQAYDQSMANYQQNVGQMQANAAQIQPSTYARNPVAGSDNMAGNQIQMSSGPFKTGGVDSAEYQKRMQQAMMAANPEAGQTMSTATPNRAPGLGLGLGLNPHQRANFQEAAQAGQGASYLGEHQNLAKRVQNRVQAGSPQEAKLQQFIATGQAQRPMATPYAAPRSAMNNPALIKKRR